jgi:hypothetical protein
MFPVDETFKGVKHAGVTYSVNEVRFNNIHISAFVGIYLI